MNARIKNALAFSLILQVIFVKWIGQYPSFIERYYSNGIYPYISGFLRGLYGWLPFSLGDVLYTLLILLALRYVYKQWHKIRQKPFFFLREVMAILAVAYFTFHLLWGLNYYRQPISETMGLNEAYTSEALVSFTTSLIERTNMAHRALVPDDSVQVSIPYSQKELLIKVPNGYAHLQRTFPQLQYSPYSIKGSMYSLLLTYMGYGGYLNPFTQEAQVNQKIPDFRFPVVSSHEVAHQLGYAAENEANFIGYLAAANNDDPYFRYTALSYALSYCLSEVRNTDEALFREQYARINKGVRKDYEALNRFWTSYENPMEPLFKSVFNTFLKANNQPQGIRSYSLVVALLVAYHQEHPI
jgi:hypothetical protein